MKKTNHVAFVLDSSGSMSRFQDDFVKAYNAQVDAVRDGARVEKIDTTVSLVTFGDSVDTHFFAEPVSELTRDINYTPRGMTRLFDAVGGTIEKLKRLKQDKGTSFLVLVQTDGDENDSRLWAASDLKALMDKVQATDKWTIAFSVPPGMKRTFCASFGFPEGNVREWEATGRGAREVGTATATSTRSYFAGRSAGLTATKAFYLDVDVKPSVIKKNLENVADQVNIWTVPKECQIGEFVSLKSRKPYRKGSAFYQLTKPELVQESKEILVMEKGKDAVWGGDDARDVLGVPEGRVKITPGNHGQYDIFVQSTSSNRKLVRGTKLICTKGTFGC